MSTAPPKSFRRGFGVPKKHEATASAPVGVQENIRVYLAREISSFAHLTSDLIRNSGKNKVPR